MESDYAAYGIALNGSNVTADVFHYGYNTPSALMDQYDTLGLHAQYLIPVHAAKGYYAPRSNIHFARFPQQPEPRQP